MCDYCAITNLTEVKIKLIKNIISPMIISN